MKTPNKKPSGRKKRARRIKAGSVVTIKGITWRGLSPQRRYTVKSIRGKYAYIRGLGWGLRTALREANHK